MKAPTKSILNQYHEQLGAKLIEFSGTLLPAWYTSVKEEHLAVRKDVGIFDISHMGVIKLTGDGALNTLQKVSCNDMNKTLNNRMVYSMILNEKGMVLDDVMVGEVDGQFIMVVNAGNYAKINEWLTEIKCPETTITPCYDIGMIAVQGPNAIKKCDDILGTALQDTKRFSIQKVADINGVSGITMRTGYTGEDGVELLIHKDEIGGVWETLLNAGLSPCGLAARDSLRLEAGLPLYGQELSESIHPWMTRYGWVVDLTHEFIGRDALMSLKESSLEWTTVGIEMVDRGIPRPNYPIEEGGYVTSGTLSPLTEKRIGMALVNPEYAEEGTEVTVDIRGKGCKARVVKPPFYERS